MKSTLFLAIIASSLMGTAHASETDAFTFRYTDIQDSTEIIDAEMNRRMNEAMERTNAQTLESAESCNSELLFKSLKKQFHRPVYGKVEGWIKNHKEIPHARVPVRRSIYREIPFFQNMIVHTGQIGLGPVIRLNGQLIGNDKIGHFLDEGRHNFNAVQEILKTGNANVDPVATAVDYGIETENGIFGLKPTGVYSYADTAANFNGLNFWMRINGTPMSGTGASYYSCDQGTWKRNAHFTFRDYVDAAWDEGINCSDYRNEKYLSHVMNQISILEKNDPLARPYACPVDRKALEEIAPKYGIYAKDILNPNVTSRAHVK